MVTISIDGDNLMVVVNGIGKVLALRSELTVPLKHVVGAKADPQAASLPKASKAQAHEYQG